MSNGDFKHDVDDELLSAYIDGELSEAECAAAEARLANDPDAKQLVHQLRSVSQSVQRLPLESVGRDLSETILRRAEAMKPMQSGAKSASPTASALIHDAPPTGGIFHSRRPWIWASLALAAGLMIMLLQRGAENDKLPAVAQHAEGRAGDGASQLELSRFGRETGQQPPPAVDPSMVAKSDSEPALMPMAAPSAPSDALPPAKTEALGDQLAANDYSYGSRFRGGESKNEPPPPSDAAAAPTPSAPALTDVPTDEEIRKGIVATRPASPPPANASEVAGTSAPAPAAKLPPASEVASAPHIALGAKSEPRTIDATRGAAIADGKAVKPAPADVAAAEPGGGGGFGGGIDRGRAHYDASGRLNAPAEGKPLPVVVHVVANAESFRQQSIDKLLTKRGVVLESASESKQLAANEKRGGGAVSGVDAEGERLEVLTKRKSDTEGAATDFDFVLVEAPQATIASCLTDLKADATNYVSVEVVEPSASKDRVEESLSLGKNRDKSAESDFGKYNRGVVSQEQKLAFQNYYSQLDIAGKELTKGEREAVDRFIAELETTDQRELAEQSKKATSELGGVEVHARARRLSRLDLKSDDSKVAAPRAGVAGSAATTPPEVLRRAQSEPQTTYGMAAPVENLHVLFVISPQPATAATGTAPPEASAPTQKASK